jgi:hypothetical protein
MNDLNEEDFWRELFVVKMRLEERRIAALQANPDLPRSQEAKKPRSQEAEEPGDKALLRWVLPHRAAD